MFIFRIALEHEEENEDEERRIEFEENCLEMFDRRAIDDGFHFYLSQ